MKTNFFTPILFLGIFFLLIIHISGCSRSAGQTDSAQGSFILGFSQIGAESAWRNRHTRSVQEAAEEAGIQLLFFNAEQKQENQIRAIRSFIAYQVDVIAFVPIVSTGWEHVLEEARDAGIPVLVCDREISIHDESLFAGFIGTNSLQEGRSAAEFLLEKFAPRPEILPDDENLLTESLTAEEIPPAVVFSQDRPVRIVELSGTVGSSVAINRAQGFREVINEHNAGWIDGITAPLFAIMHSASGDFLRSKGYEIASYFLDMFDEIDVLFSHNDGMTLGAIDAMKERGIQPGTDIVIVTIDGEQAVIDALRRGEINGVVECDPVQGPQIIRLAGYLARGGQIPRMVYMQGNVFSSLDDHSAIRPRGY